MPTGQEYFALSEKILSQETFKRNMGRIFNVKI